MARREADVCVVPRWPLTALGAGLCRRRRIWQMSSIWSFPATTAAWLDLIGMARHGQTWPGWTSQAKPTPSSCFSGCWLSMALTGAGHSYHPKWGGSHPPGSPKVGLVWLFMGCEQPRLQGTDPLSYVNMDNRWSRNVKSTLRRCRMTCQRIWSHMNLRDGRMYAILPDMNKQTSAHR